MYRKGHIGAALLAYAPLGAVTLAVGFETTAVVGALAAAGLAMVPDYDQRVPGIKHRGVTHTVRFAGVVGIGTAIVGGVVAGLHPEMGAAGVAGWAVFGGVVGTLTIIAHIGADALTPMGVEPFGDDGPHITYGVCRADSTLGNYGLLALGVAGTLLAYGIGSGLNSLLPV